MARKRIELDKRKIVEKAWEMVHTQGPAALSARKIAKALGVSPMTLYKYVDNIDHIVKELIIKGFSVINRGIEERLSVERIETPEGLLRLMADEVFKFAVDHGDVYAMMFNADGTKFRNDPDLFALYSGLRRTMGAHFGEPFVERNHRGIYVYEVFLNGLIVEKLKNRVDLGKAEFDRHIEFCIRKLIDE